MPSAPAILAVVIPFFQREPGILGRAFRSVFAQTPPPDCEVAVLVVDDASPISAASELAVFTHPTRFPVRILSRPNGGPGAARNTALDHLPAGTRYVAFLDSDDEWSPAHLLNGCAALEAGFDVYFADLMQLGAQRSAFARAGRLDPARHARLGERKHLHRYDEDMLGQIVSGNVIGTPTVVYRIERFPAVRFRPEYRSAGEDYLFWMDLAAAGARFAFSDQVEAICGRGVNVYAGVAWGSEALLWRLHDEMRYRAFSLKHYTLSHAQRAQVRSHRWRLRKEFARVCLHRALRLRPVPWRLLRSLVVA